MKPLYRFRATRLSLILSMTVCLGGVAGHLLGQTIRVTPWPRPVPCRVQDGSDRDVFVTTLGEITTPLATGTFDPRKDEVRLGNGNVLRNYFKETLGIRYFAPLDKRLFPLPPSGWCSWYYYYQDFGEQDIERDAVWIATHLRDFGASYIQIDDGWQGVGHGSGDNRDWSTIDKRFPGGMARLATTIKNLHMKAGIWLAPHGQSNKDVVKANPGVFLLQPDGTSASDTWEGKYLLDPSTPAAGNYLRKLFTTLSSWGYEYFKIDGQPIVIEEYRKKASMMHRPNEDADALYRSTLDTIRATVGLDHYLLGCWGIPLDGVGIMNGSRIGEDVLPGWSGFRVALDATMKYYFLHNIAWYCDPDVMLVRSPLTIDQARAWATLQGLTGQALMTSDRMSELPEERLAIVKKVYPALDIRPLDLFPSSREKHIWDLKVSHLGRSYDVVGVFNFEERSSQLRFLSWHALGLPDSTPMHVFDFWNEEYLGAWERGISLEISPSACRVFAVVPDNGQIRLVSTNRHISQGYADLESLSIDEKSNAFHGVSDVVKGEPYRLQFAFPRGKNFVVARAKAGAFPVRIANHQGWATVEFTCPANAAVTWDVAFEPALAYRYPVRKPDNLTCEPAGLTGADLRWDAQYYQNAGYQVFLDGKLLGYSPTNAFAIRNLQPDTKYVAAVSTVWEDGSTSKEKAEYTFSVASMLPPKVSLSDIEPVDATSGWGVPVMDRSVAGRPLSVAGVRTAKGIGTHADSEIKYDLFGMFENFSAEVGIDDGNGSDKGSVEFAVIGDGKELWHSGVVKKGDQPKPISVAVAGVRTLALRVTKAGDVTDYDHADWLDASLTREH